MGTSHERANLDVLRYPHAAKRASPSPNEKEAGSAPRLETPSPRLTRAQDIWPRCGDAFAHKRGTMIAELIEHRRKPMSMV